MRQIAVALILSAVCLSATAEEKLDMEGTRVHGNIELPKVLYIVPWQHAELPDIGQPPLESLIDEALTPVDREVFQRQIRYHDALTAQDVREAATK